MLMEVFYLRGDHAAAISAWDRCRTMLRELYGVQPSSATRELGQTILQAARDQESVTPSAQPNLPATVLRPPRLIARGSAMQSVLEGWRAGEAVCVTGEAGLGKSRLLADFVGVAGPCAIAAGRPGDEVLPYATLSRLMLAAIDRFHPQLDAADVMTAARLLPRLPAIIPQEAPEPREATTGVRNEFERTQALLAVARLLGGCVRAGCVAFVLDDLQFADAASVEAMRMLAEPKPVSTISDRPQTNALRFVFAARPEEMGSGSTSLLASLAATGRYRRIDLMPLTEREAAESRGEPRPCRSGRRRARCARLAPGGRQSGIPS